MAKIKYQATLASGMTITRNSERTYTHYWQFRSVTPGQYGDGGFAGSLTLAQKAVATASARHNKFNPGAPARSEIVEVQIVK